MAEFERTLEVPPDFKGFVFEDGAHWKKEADGAGFPVWISVPLSTAVAPTLHVKTTLGKVTSENGRRGKALIVPVRQGRALIYLSSTVHGRGILTVERIGKVMGRATLQYEPSFISIVKRLLQSVVSIVIAVVVLRGYVLEGIVVPTESQREGYEESSMTPTIDQGERIFQWKFVYRFRRPYRGEIITFWHPVAGEGRIRYIKRVIGVPGDRVRVERDQIYVNAVPIEEPYLKNVGETYGMTIPEMTVPDGAYWVAGDNRPASDDSRYWPGDIPAEDPFVRKKDLEGKPFLVYWPPSHLRFIFGHRIRAENGRH